MGPGVGPDFGLSYSPHSRPSNSETQFQATAVVGKGYSWSPGGSLDKRYGFELGASLTFTHDSKRDMPKYREQTRKLVDKSAKTSDGGRMVDGVYIPKATVDRIMKP